MINCNTSHRINDDLSTTQVFAISGMGALQKFFRLRNFANSTSPSMIGTSQNKPMVVPSAANEPTPYIETAAAMAISKWLDEPMRTVISPSLYANPANLVTIKLKETTIKKPNNSGMETKPSKSK